MALTFTRAPLVEAGDRITSTQFAKQADAWNDRLISGIGDGPWRLVFYFLNLFRQVRNSDGFLSFPPPQEFFDIYQHINPEEARWPEAGPGDPEGANVANPMNAYVFGATALDLESETDRYANLIFLQAPPNEKSAWEYAKQQRGAVDPTTGALASPAFLVARSHFRIRYNAQRSPHGLSYGGFLPTPNYLGQCVEDLPSSDFPPPSNFLVRFSKLEPTLSIEEGKTYVVTKGTVQYDGEVYGAGSTFVGAAGVTDFLVPNPDYDPEDPESGDQFIPPDPEDPTNRVHETLEFPGTCPPSSPTEWPGEPYIGHVAYISYQPEAYYIWTNAQNPDTGAVYADLTHILLTNEWLEGPYFGEARLRKTDGGHLQRSLWNFLREFRGSTSQRDDQQKHLEHAFDFQRLFTTQYHLAPAKGTQVEAPDGELQIDVVYPAWERTTDAAAATVIGSPYTYSPQFILASAFLEADKLASAVTLELLEGTTVKATITLTPDEDGKATKLWMADEAGLKDWSPTEDISWRVTTPLTFTGEAGKFLKIETTELFPYKPQLQDAAMLVRAMSCISSQPDGTGAHETEADAHSTNYFRYGCIVNQAGIPGIEDPLDGSVNWNAVYDAARRWSKFVRCPRRQEFIGYEVTGGNSILYFKRYAYGLHLATPADVWDGIAPARERLANGDVRSDYVYEVREGSVEYNGTTYTQGQRFTGIFGVGSWTETDDENLAHVYEADGIRLVAPKQDVTNEWLLGVELAAYDPESVVFNYEDYTDQQVPLLQRCHFYSPEVAGDRPLLFHSSYGQRVGTSGVLAPEIPTGWNYSSLEFAFAGNHNANTIACPDEDEGCKEIRRQFYKSCRVYEPDIEVEKCEVVIEGGEEIVKVTLKGRLHHCAEAPASISRSMASWDINALRAEPYRTWENGLREYLHNIATGGPDGGGATHCTKTQPGNRSANSSVLELQTLEGTCYPKIRLVKLIPKPFADDNDSQEFADTKFLHDAHAQMEFYLRVMCEGYVDGVTSADLACTYNSLSVYDYSYEQLCFQAFGNRWMPGFTPEDYPQNTQTFGPIPNTVARAYVFNCLSKAVNLLTTARVMLPALIESRVGDGKVYDAVAGTSGGGSGGEICSGPLSAVQVYAQHGGGSAPITDWTDWDAAGGGGGVGSSTSFTGNCVGGLFEVAVASSAVEFRWRLVDPDAYLALPESWREMLQTNGSVLARTTLTSSAITGMTFTQDNNEAEHCNYPDQSPLWAFRVDGQGYIIWQVDQPSPVVGCGFLEGSYTAPPAPASYIGRVRRPDGAECGWGPSASVNIEIINGVTPMVTVPLED